MRTIWLASTALIIGCGIASAQTPQSSSSPAPTGAIASPQVAPSKASPGNMAPNSANTTGQGMTDTTTPANNGTSSPAPDGAVNAPSQNSAMPSAAPGKTAPAPAMGTNASAGSGMGMGTGTGMKHHWHHHWSQSGGMGATHMTSDGSAASYLHMADHAIAHHNAMQADDALSHAETRLLNRAVPQGQVAADDSPAIQSIEDARKALHAHDFAKAKADIKQAAGAAGSM